MIGYCGQFGWMDYGRGYKWWVTTGIMVCLGGELWCINRLRRRLVCRLAFSPSYPQFFHRFIHSILTLSFVTDHRVVCDKTLSDFFVMLVFRFQNDVRQLLHSHKSTKMAWNFSCHKAARRGNKDRNFSPYGSKILKNNKIAVFPGLLFYAYSKDKVKQCEGKRQKFAGDVEGVQNRFLICWII